MVKVEEIKEEIKESVNDPLYTVHQNIGCINICEDIKEEIKEVPSFNQ